MLHKFKPNYGGLARRLSAVAMLTAVYLPAAAGAQQSRVDQLAQKVRDYTTVFEMYEHQTDLCKAYIGKIVAISAFPTTGSDRPIILNLPTDRDFITYYAGPKGGFIAVKVGAFGAVPFMAMDDAELDAMEFIAASAPLENGTRMVHSVTDRPIRTYVSRNGLGTSVTVSEVERKANFIYSAQRLFPYAADSQTAIMGVEVGLAQGPRMSQTLRVALAVVPKAPYLLKFEGDGAVPTMRTPVQNKYKLTNLYADAKCGLVLDSRSRVLAAANAGS